MKLKQRIADWMFEHTSFPNARNHAERSELWFLKGNCIVCVANPYEKLSNGEYTSKYPANCNLRLGYERIQLCEHHAKQLANVLQQFMEENT